MPDVPHPPAADETALVDAARVESARVYATTCPEFHNVPNEIHSEIHRWRERDQREQVAS